LIGLIYVALFGDLSQIKDSLWKMSVPSLCYLAQNNFQFIALSNLDSCSFQILYQIKTFTTALFSIFLLGK
jgi:UDP-sugar transporter A1/2/3